MGSPVILLLAERVHTRINQTDQTNHASRPSRASHVHGRVHLPPMHFIPNSKNRMSRLSLTENGFHFSVELSDCKVQCQAMTPQFALPIERRTRTDIPLLVNES